MTEKTKKTKLLDLFKEFEIKTTVGLVALKERGFRYKGFNNYVEEEEIPEVKQALFEIQEEIEEKSKRMKELSKAKFIGVVQDKITGRFKRLMLKIDLSELEGIEHDLVEVGENSTIFGSKLDLLKDLQRNVIADPRDYE